MENKEVWVYAEQAKITVCQLCNPHEIGIATLGTMALGWMSLLWKLYTERCVSLPCSYGLLLAYAFIQ